jgi:hypothetical protein
MEKRMLGKRAGLRICVISAFLLIVTQVHGQASSTPDVSRHLNLMGFTLEKNTLADVESKLGPSTRGSCSQEVEASKMICYVSAGTSKTRIFFESGSSGGWARLDGFRVESENVTPNCRLQCKSTTAFGGDIQTSGGMKLGLTKAELIALLGPPRKVSGNRLTFEWWSKRPMTKAEIDQETQTFKAPVTSPYWDVQDRVEVTLNDSKVSEFEVHHTVTY